MILTEFRENKNSGFFRTKLAELGYLNTAVASIKKGLNTVFIASKDSFVSETFYKELNEESHRLVLVHFKDISIAGVLLCTKK